MLGNESYHLAYDFQILHFRAGVWVERPRKPTFTDTHKTWRAHSLVTSCYIAIVSTQWWHNWAVLLPICNSWDAGWRFSPHQFFFFLHHTSSARPLTGGPYGRTASRNRSADLHRWKVKIFVAQGHYVHTMIFLVYLLLVVLQEACLAGIHCLARNLGDPSAVLYIHAK